MVEKQLVGKKYYMIGTIFVCLIFLTVLFAFSGNLFKVFSSYSLLIYTAVAIWEIFYERTLPKKIATVVLVSSIYFFAVPLFNANAGIGSFILITVSILNMVTMNSMAVKKKLLIFLEKYAFFSVLAMTIVSFYIHGSVANYVAFCERGVNPNTWAEITIFLAMVYASVHIQKSKLLNLVILLCALVTAFNCRTRFMTVAALVYTLLYLLPVRVFKGNRMLLFTIAVVLVGTLFPFLYLFIYKSGFQMMIYGKEFFTGREVIWDSIFSSMSDHKLKLLFGVGSNFNAEVTNTHSVYLGVLADFGIIGYVLYFGFIIYLISKKGNNIEYENTKNGLLMFVIGNLFMGITETSMLWSGVFCLSYIGLGLADPVNYNVHGTFFKVKNPLRLKKCG